MPKASKPRIKSGLNRRIFGDTVPKEDKDVNTGFSYSADCGSNLDHF
jgi:hypothetical protein